MTDHSEPTTAAGRREALTVEAIRGLGIPSTLHSDYELHGALSADRRLDDPTVPLTSDAYDRRVLINVIAWLAEAATLAGRLVTFLETEVPYWGDMPGQEHRWQEYNRLIREVKAEAAASSEGLDVECVYCGGQRWTEDENWQPDDPATWNGQRSHGNGLIPCGRCNEGGWNTPDYEPLARPEPVAATGLDVEQGGQQP